ncbi:hypothetical protein C2857_002523 [Epichloe festucae Fl1]|uniref:CENP-T/Histone H4 histone fold domain-containing protein n=1 Tax=Epichloe festucae (strain Fl1) TaxID=877507 RepID=A0A7U3SNU5_EPIFF|nr:hypothetical protein C2857_002523 [Epichloe festucae Fl1]
MDSSPDENSSRNKTPYRTAAAAAAAAARTPVNRRAASAEPPSSHRSALRTPIDRTLTRDLLSSVRRGVSASGGRRNNAPTPHAAAARRALDQRRTALLTPGKGRRQSLREQRETPMGLLQDLGRVLATNTRPIASSSPRDKPSSIAPVPEEDEGEGYDDDDDDDDDLPIQPRLSLPLNDDEEDSELVPPRSAGLEDDTGTVPNVELPMRALSEQPGRYSGISFGSRRDSDVFDRDDDTEDMGRQSDFFPGLLEDLQARANAAADPTLNRIDVDDATVTTGQRESDFGLEIPPDVADQTTFMMSEPPADGGGTSPLQERSIAEAGAYNAANTSGVGDVTLDIGGNDVDVYDDPGPDLDFVQNEDEVDRYAGDEVDVAEEEEGAQEAGMEDQSESAQPSSAAKPRQQTKPKKRQRRISRYGIEYPPLPPTFVKRVAQTALHSSGLSNPRVSADTLTALTQASEWFFEQVADDLGAYANHANRNTIEESDVATLMRRQRQITSDATMFSLAHRHLPRELLQELKMPVPVGGKIPRKRIRPDDDETEDSSEVTWTQSS